MIHADHVEPNWDSVQVLNHEFWSRWLPEVVDTSRVVPMLDGIVNGVPIGRPPCDRTVESPNWPSARECPSKVTDIIRADLSVGKLLGPFVSPPFDKYVVSPLGAIPKRGSDRIRLIHDLSYPTTESVNIGIDPEAYSLQYSSVDWAVSACSKYEVPLLANIDIKDAYKAVGVAGADWHLLGLRWQVPGLTGDYFFGKVLSFGLRSAPALFDEYACALEKIMPLVGVSCHVVRYVDDFLIVGGSESQVKGDLGLMIDTARSAGFTIQAEKVKGPCRVLEFLGIVLDLDRGVLRISDERMAEIRTILSDCQGLKLISKRRLLRVVGKLAFAARVVRTGRAFLGRLIGLAKSAKALHHRVRLSAAARADLAWWQDCIQSHNGTCMMSPDWTQGEILHVFTDASDYGFGAVWGDLWFGMVYSGQMADLRSRSINWRELHVAVRAMATWAPSFAGKKVMFHIDNQATCGILNKLYTPVGELMELVRLWCLLVESHSVITAVVYINTNDNVLADAISRGDLNTFFATHSGSPSRVWPTPISYFNEVV